MAVASAGKYTKIMKLEYSGYLLFLSTSFSKQFEEIDHAHRVCVSSVLQIKRFMDLSGDITFFFPQQEIRFFLSNCAEEFKHCDSYNVVLIRISEFFCKFCCLFICIVIHLKFIITRAIIYVKFITGA